MCRTILRVNHLFGNVLLKGLLGLYEIPLHRALRSLQPHRVNDHEGTSLLKTLVSSRGSKPLADLQRPGIRPAFFHRVFSPENDQRNHPSRMK